MQNVDTVVYKFRSALTKATHYRLKVNKKEKQKREKIVKRWKIKAMAAKHYRN